MGISPETTHEFQMWKKLDFWFRPIIQSTNVSTHTVYRLIEAPAFACTNDLDTRLLLLTRLALETRLVLELQFWSLLSVYWSQEVSQYQHTLVVVISGLSTDISCLFSVRGHQMATKASLFKELAFGTASLPNSLIQRFHLIWFRPPACIMDLASVERYIVWYTYRHSEINWMSVSSVQLSRGMGKLQKFDIEFESQYGVCHAGQSVIGVVCIDLSDATKLTGKSTCSCCGPIV